MSDPNQPYGAVPPPPYPPPGAPSAGPPGGPPGGPPFPPPPGSGGGDAGKGLWIALAVVGVVALAGVIVALVLLLTGDDKDADDEKADDPASSATSSATSGTTATDDPTASAATSTPADPSTTASGRAEGTSTADAVANEPKAVVEAFLGSVLDGDCATAEDLVTEAYIEDEGDCDPDDIPTDLADQVTYTVGDAKVNDAAGTATVPVDADFAGTKETSTVELVKVDGRWLVNEFD